MTAPATILLADDSRFFLTIERQFLRSVPVVILEAQSTVQVPALCRAQRPQLIYMACDMPGESGAECCRRLKADPLLQGIPVVLICDEKRPEQIEQSRRAGCDALLTKPLDRQRFLEIGRSLLAGIREPRRPCVIRLRYRLQDRLVTARGLDISRGGLFVESHELPAPGVTLQMEMQLSLPGEQGPWISGVGVVAWLNQRERPMKPNHPVGFGVKFTDLPMTSAGVLNGFLKVLESRGGGKQ
jgi:CheY-like chemotaxis protein